MRLRAQLQARPVSLPRSFSCISTSAKQDETAPRCHDLHSRWSSDFSSCSKVTSTLSSTLSRSHPIRHVARRCSLRTAYLDLAAVTVARSLIIQYQISEL